MVAAKNIHHGSCGCVTASAWLLLGQLVVFYLDLKGYLQAPYSWSNLSMAG